MLESFLLDVNVPEKRRFSATSDFPAYEFRNSRLEAVSLNHKTYRLRLRDDGKG